ncbi:hypothetical protein GGI11_002607, partial [Coemansia sp. RSA 2049]
MAQEGDKSDQTQSNGLSQSDFRSFLSQKPTAATPHHQHRQYKQPKRAARRQSDKQPAQKRYRDRAAERRKGTDSAASYDRYPSTNAISYEESKFLGGDIERTHLVKGLDYLLLQKNRTNADADASDNAVQNELFSETTPTNSENPKTELGKHVLSLCLKQQSLSDSIDAISLSELFAPGRMYFEIATDFSCKVTTRIRSQQELAEYLATSTAPSTLPAIPESDRLVLSTIIKSLSKPEAKPVAEIPKK